jgi:hypothetical protein
MRSLTKGASLTKRAHAPLELGEIGGAIAQRPIGGRTATFRLFRRADTGAIAGAGAPPPGSTSAALAARRHSKPWYLIDPRRSTALLPAWDVWTTAALLFTALVTPYEVAFLTLPAAWAAA